MSAPGEASDHLARNGDVVGVGGVAKMREQRRRELGCECVLRVVVAGHQKGDQEMKSEKSCQSGIINSKPPS